MLQVSPYAYAHDERRGRLLTTGLLLGLFAIIFLAAGWVAQPVEERPDRKSKEQAKANGSVPADSEIGESVTPSAAVWSKQLAAIQRRLPNEGIEGSPSILTQIDSLAKRLAKTPISDHSQKKIQDMLVGIEQQVSLYRDQIKRPPVHVEGFREEVDVQVASRVDAEENAMTSAIQDVERPIREQMGTQIRKVQLELRSYQDESTKLRQRIAQLQREQAKVAAKEARAAALRSEMADVIKYLQPFTESGYLQPKGGKNPWNTERTIDAKPVSLSRLEAQGALERSMEGLKRLYLFGGGRNPGLNNDRPLGNFPQFYANQLQKQAVQAAVERAQQLLRKHGQALVEQRLLAP